MLQYLRFFFKLVKTWKLKFVFLAIFSTKLTLRYCNEGEGMQSSEINK